MKTYKHPLLVFPAALVLTLVIGAGPASAMADEQANGVGEFASSLNQFGQTFGVQGLGGRLIAEAALREGAWHGTPASTTATRRQGTVSVRG